jgi:hypothetical protein
MFSLYVLMMRIMLCMKKDYRWRLAESLYYAVTGYKVQVTGEYTVHAGT